MNLTQILLIICIAVWFLMFFFLKWYIKRRTTFTRLMPEYIKEVNKFKAEIDAVTDRNLLMLEASVKKLKDLIEDANKLIADYETGGAKPDTGETLYTHLSQGIRSALKTEAPGSPSAPKPAPQSTPQSAPQLSIVRPNIETRQDILSPAAAPPQTAPQDHLKLVKSKREIRAQIDLLLNEGISPEKIASRLEISLAEVELAINLRRKK
jgi:hypothetical protein